MEKSSEEIDLTYGRDTHGRLHFEGEVTIAQAGTNASKLSAALKGDLDADRAVGAAPVLAQLTDAVAAALSAPIEFPSVEQAIVPGDRVVLAVDATVPRLAEVVQEVIAYFQQHGCSADQFSVVLAGHAEFDVSELAKVLPGEVALEVHDPDDSTKVAYVAANKQGEPIYMNRSLVDADVVLPIMCARGKNAIDYEGAYGVFPLLTDRKTRGQFYSLRQLADPAEHQRLTGWADEAAWWVGLLVAIQVVPAAGGGIARIMAGDPQHLEAAVQQMMSALWDTKVSDTYESVVALIDGGANQQTWDSVARVLASATPLLKPEGALIICTELDHRPGAALVKLGSPNRSEDALARQLSHDSSDDALAAAVLLESLDTTHVYLLSQLPGDVVESMGMSALQDLHQVEQVLRERKQCLVIPAAQHRTFS